MIKKLISAVAGVGLMLATVVPAMAVNQCGNQTTGPSSTNVCHRSLDKFKLLTITNSGNVTHTVNSIANSGNSIANGNTSGGTVGTGHVFSTVVKQASLNTGNVTLTQTDPTADETGINDITGPSSNNTVNMTTNKSITLTLTNDGNVTQTVHSEANTGNNSSSNNTIGGSVTTGNATSDVSVITIMNDFNINLSQ